MGEGNRWRNLFGGGENVKSAKTSSPEEPSPEAILEEANSKLDWLEAHMAAIDRTPKTTKDISDVDKALAAIFKSTKIDTQIIDRLKKIVADFDEFNAYESEGLPLSYDLKDWQEPYFTNSDNQAVVIKIRNWLEEQESDK